MLKTSLSTTNKSFLSLFFSCRILAEQSKAVSNSNEILGTRKMISDARAEKEKDLKYTFGATVYSQEKQIMLSVPENFFPLPTTTHCHFASTVKH